MEQTNITPSEADGKTVAIVSYLSIIGWLIAYFAMHKDKKTAIGSYHLRQTLLLHIIYLCLYVVLTYVLLAAIIGSGGTGAGFMAYLPNILYLGLFILWLIGFIAAINGQQKPMPLIGEKAQTMFPNI